MSKINIFFFILIISLGIALSALFYIHKPNTRLDSTLIPVYTLFGHATKGISRAITEITPIDSMDEKQYGDIIKSECDMYNDPDDRNNIYLNTLISGIQPFIKKPFSYRVYIYDSSSPNAFALPGGVIFVTRGLLQVLKSESELMAVLAHETGHIELSHCMDAVRFELLAKKTGAGSLGQIADIVMNILLNHSFSKTQEEEADAYAFKFLKNSKYDPKAQGKVFAAFMKYQEQYKLKEENHAQIIRDYFQSHPPLQLREEKYSEKAKVWWESNYEKRYVGVKNLTLRDATEFKDEWVLKN